MHIHIPAGILKWMSPNKSWNWTQHLHKCVTHHLPSTILPFKTSYIWHTTLSQPHHHRHSVVPSWWLSSGLQPPWLSSMYITTIQTQCKLSPILWHTSTITTQLYHHCHSALPLWHTSLPPPPPLSSTTITTLLCYCHHPALPLSPLSSTNTTTQLYCHHHSALLLLPLSSTTVTTQLNCHMVTWCQPWRCRKSNIACMNTGRTALTIQRCTCLSSSLVDQKKKTLWSQKNSYI